MSTPFETLERTASAYRESCVLTAAAELDLFTTILEQDNRLTAEKLAEILQTDFRATAVLLNALTALEYLTKDGQGDTAFYGVAEPYCRLLDSRTSESYIPMLRLTAAGQRRWVQLTSVVRDGKPLPSFYGNEKEHGAFIQAMNSIAEKLLPATITSMREAGIFRFGKPEIRFIDIGGASGTYTQAFLDAIPESVGTVFDLPPGAQAARKRFLGSVYEPRVTIIEGDFYKDELPGGYDFAWISAIIHQHGVTESKALFGKTYRALNSGGTVAVRDFIMNEQRTSPKEGTLFGINMLMGTETGMVYTYNEVRNALAGVGFENVKLTVPADTMSAIVTAQKR